MQIPSMLSRKGYGIKRQVKNSTLLKIASALGIPVPDTREQCILKHLRPTPKQEAKKNTLSSRYGTGVFPFHTDTAYWQHPADYLLLYCVNPGCGKRQTLLSDATSWCLPQAKIDILVNEIWKVVMTPTPFLCTVGNVREGFLRIRFDQDCMLPAVPGKDEAIKIVLQAIRDSSQEAFSWKAGDLLILDNQRILHSRGESILEPDPDRHLIRILVRRGMQNVGR